MLVPVLYSISNLHLGNWISSIRNAIILICSRQIIGELIIGKSFI